ncbi:hypothetical protein E4U21_001771 [Claviceps maximensis]|nr:hypothetical protein E4U21_001771 [Claviceps maximensis]
MKSTLVLSTVIGAGVASAATCPAPGFKDNQGRYSCNPSVHYPNGQTCKTIDGCLFLVGADGKPIISSPSTAATNNAHDCPAPGFKDSQGRYSCNPAVHYPNGQTCKTIDGCLFLVGADGKPIISSPSTTDDAQLIHKRDCPAPGSKDSQGRYSCNPAHQYPNGQTCQTIDGCLVLVDATASASQPTNTPACPAPGSTDSQGRYSCNPAHQYPNGETCKTIDGCFFLVDANGNPAINTPSTATGAAQPTNTPACPAPGFTDSRGRYSCNPAHQYPNGQTCKAIDGCLFLVDANGNPIISTPSSTAVPQPTGSSACLPAGSSDSQGRYSCNPAHQYPEGQTCQAIDGCYLLVGADGKPICNNPTGASPSMPVVTGAAATVERTGILALIAAAVALL